MRRVLVAVTLVALLASCRTSRPDGDETPVSPLLATDAPSAQRELAERRAQLRTERSLVRIRATNGSQSQSFRAQLQVDGSGRMLLTAYTPLGTNAIRLYTAGDEVTFVNDLEGTWWHGSAGDFAGSFGFFGNTSPHTIALLMIGLPGAGNNVLYQYGPSGIANATAGDVLVDFSPPIYPPKHVSVVHGAQKLEIETLQTAMTTALIVAPDVPKSYRCCVAPRL